MGDWILKHFYAICLRQLSKFSQAEALFHEVITEFGRQGAFNQQGRGMLELGILYRQQGLYQQAIQLMEHAIKVLRLQEDMDYAQKADVEVAQALLDSGDLPSSEAVVSKLMETHHNNPRVLILFAEIFLRRKDYATALYYAEQAEQFAQGPNLGRVYAVLGRISANSEEVDIEIGQNWF